MIDTRKALGIMVIMLRILTMNALECPEANKTCVFKLVIRAQLTMYAGIDKIVIENGKLYNCSRFTNKCTKFNGSPDVIWMDGYERSVITVNGSIPGPPLIVYQDQNVEVEVENQLLSEGVAIHWHGIHQRGTPYMDGVAMVTQCPIPQGAQFTYKFKAFPRGTHWYHAHSGGQRANGLFGALIVKRKTSKKPRFEYTDEFIMTVGDWHHTEAGEGFLRMLTGYFIGKNPLETSETLDGGKFSALPWEAAVIEGRGAYAAKNLDVLPIKRFDVEGNRNYRFRVIGSGELYPLKISVDRHSLLLISSDGHDLKPKKVDSFVINPGERYDFILKTDQAVNRNYWIRAESLEVGKVNHFAKAILHYSLASSSKKPKTTPRPCSPFNPCIVANCPFPMYPLGSDQQCLTYRDLESNVSIPTPTYKIGSSEQYFLNFAFPGKGTRFPGSVNGRAFVMPSSPVLSQPKDVNNDCKDYDCGKDKICYCYSSLKLSKDKTVQLVLTNLGTGTGWAHPIHIHGYHFHVLKAAFANVNKKTGKIISSNSDVECIDNFCNEAQWANQSWTGNNIPGLNIATAPIKDTLIIPPGGYAVTRIYTGNPGQWFIHCHIEIHLLDGMATVITVAPEKVASVPKDFPRCGSYTPKSSAKSTQALKGIVILGLTLALLMH